MAMAISAGITPSVRGQPASCRKCLRHIRQGVGFAGGAQPAIPTLTLRVLRTAACFAAADFLSLHLARIAGHETGVAQGLAQGLVVFDQGTGDAVADGARLARDSA